MPLSRVGRSARALVARRTSCQGRSKPLEHAGLGTRMVYQLARVSLYFQGSFQVLLAHAHVRNRNRIIAQAASG